MPTAAAARNSKGPSETAEPKEEAKDHVGSCPKETLPDRGSSNGLPASEKTTVGSQQEGSPVQNKSVVSPEDTKRRQKLLDATAAQAQKLQNSLKGLIPWHTRQGSEDGQSKGKVAPPDRGSSPPDFILNLTVNWPGCQGLTSFKAADLGLKVALWIVDCPDAPASLVLYDPQRKKLEEELDLDVEPDAVAGITLTTGEVQKGEVGALLFGGRTDLGTLLNESWFYNPLSSKWIKLKCGGKVPEKRCNHAAAFSSRTRSFYISGGEGTDGKALEGIYQLVGGGEWQRLPTKGEPPARTHHSLSVAFGPSIGENLLIFGGLIEGTDSNDLWSLLLGSKNKTWTQIINAAGTPPSCRHGHSAIASGVRCFIFGGLGKHWMGWEIKYFDMNVYDVEVSSWFEIPLLSPLANTLSHGYAVAAGDPDSTFHIFAAGASPTSDGAVYSVGAVCSTLDVSVIAQGINDTKVVTGDSKQKVTELSSNIQVLNSTVTREQNAFNSLAAKADHLAATLKSLMLRIEQAHADVVKKLEIAQAFEPRAQGVAAEAAAHESEGRIKVEAMDKKMAELTQKLKNLENLRAAAQNENEVPSDESEEDK